jgi:hypothetical protein
MANALPLSIRHWPKAPTYSRKVTAMRPTGSVTRGSYNRDYGNQKERNTLPRTSYIMLWLVLQGLHDSGRISVLRRSAITQGG